MADSLDVLNDDVLRCIFDQISHFDGDDPQIWKRESEAFKTFKSLMQVSTRFHVLAMPRLVRRIEFGRVDYIRVAETLEKKEVLRKHMRLVKFC